MGGRDEGGSLTTAVELIFTLSGKPDKVPVSHSALSGGPDHPLEEETALTGTQILHVTPH